MYKGVALSILASVSFGILYFYTQFLSPLDSEQVLLGVFWPRCHF